MDRERFNELLKLCGENGNQGGGELANILREFEENVPVVLDLTTAKSVMGGKEETHNWTSFSGIGEDDGAAKTLLEIVSESKFVPRIRLKVPEWAFYHERKNYFDKLSVGYAYVDVQIVDTYLALSTPNLWGLIGYSSFRTSDGQSRSELGNALNVQFYLDASEQKSKNAFSIEVTVTHPDEMDEGGV